MAFPDHRRLIHPVPGNLDLRARPVVRTPDGYATVRSIGIGTDRGEVLIPTVHPGGWIMSDEEAMDRYGRTGEHLGIFQSPDQASAYAVRLHEDQAREYGGVLNGLLNKRD